MLSVTKDNGDILLEWGKTAVSSFWHYAAPFTATIFYKARVGLSFMHDSNDGVDMFSGFNES